MHDSPVMLDKKKHDIHLELRLQVGSSYVRHILWRSEWYPCGLQIFGDPGVHFISSFAFKCVYMCA